MVIVLGGLTAYADGPRVGPWIPSRLPGRIVSDRQGLIGNWASHNVAIDTSVAAVGVTAGEADIISDRLRTELFSTGVVNMMEREQMQDILKEQGFQQSGSCTDEACLVQIGQMLGVQVLVSGSIGRLGSMYLVNLRAIDVQTAKIIKVVSKDVSGSIENVVSELPSAAAELAGAGTKPAGVAKVAQEPAAQAPVVAATPEPVQTEKPKALSDKDDPNTNRSGIRFSFSMAPGGFDQHWVKVHSMDTTIDSVSIPGYPFPRYRDTTYETNVMDNSTQAGYTVKKDPVLSFGIGGTIKLGEIFALDLGAKYMTGALIYEKADASASITDKLTLNAPQLALGFGFTKRFSPIRIFAGINGDVDFDIATVNQSSSIVGYSSKDTSWTNVGVGYNVGASGGAEFLLGKHVGLGGDVGFNFLGENNYYYLNTNQTSGYEDDWWRLHVSPFKFGAFITIYP